MRTPPAGRRSVEASASALHWSRTIGDWSHFPQKPESPGTTTEPNGPLPTLLNRDLTMSSPGASGGHLLWTLGVSSAQHIKAYDKECRNNPNSNADDGDLYENTVTIKSTETVYGLVTKLCAGPVCDRREYGASDSHPTDHMWELHFVPAGMRLDDLDGSHAMLERLMGGDEDSDRQQTELCIGPDMECAEMRFRDMPQSEYLRRINNETKISELYALEVGGSVYLKYDMGYVR